MLHLLPGCTLTSWLGGRTEGRRDNVVKTKNKLCSIYQFNLFVKIRTRNYVSSCSSSSSSDLRISLDVNILQQLPLDHFNFCFCLRFRSNSISLSNAGERNRLTPGSYSLPAWYWGKSASSSLATNIQVIQAHATCLIWPMFVRAG